MALQAALGMPAQLAPPPLGRRVGTAAWVVVVVRRELVVLCATGSAVGVGLGVGVGVGGATYGVGVATRPTSGAATGGWATRPGNATATAVAIPPLITAAATTSAMRCWTNP